MNYLTPEYKLSLLETEDIIAASVSEKFEIINKGNGEGSVEMSADDLFR